MTRNSDAKITQVNLRKQEAWDPNRAEDVSRVFGSGGGNIEMKKKVEVVVSTLMFTHELPLWVTGNRIETSYAANDIYDGLK